ncbi:hypothetical protein Agub_g18, partial [Astrephomene gubernaculifera]
DAVLERKRQEDLLQSVRDSRYVTQKFRLKRCGLRRLYYLLEEPAGQHSLTQSVEEKTVRTAIQSALLEGFTVLRTADAPDTARQLGMLTRALERQYRGKTAADAAAAAAAAGEDEEPEVLPSYVEWSEGLKTGKQNDKVQNMFGLMLCAVPGMGQERVNRIIVRYNTPVALWDAYKEAMRRAAAAGQDPVAAAEQLLTGEVGALFSGRVYQMLFAKGAPPLQVVGSQGPSRPR